MNEIYFRYFLDINKNFTTFTLRDNSYHNFNIYHQKICLYRQFTRIKLLQEIFRFDSKNSYIIIAQLLLLLEISKDCLQTFFSCIRMYDKIQSIKP